MKAFYNVIPAATALLLVSCGQPAPKENPNYIAIGDREQLYEYFRRSPDRPILISGHRGGMTAGYPENCIASFEKTLSFTEAFFEIDPRLTKDSVIILMHDRTIDRTTDGTGRVADYTYEELLRFNLVDLDGNLTPYRIPTLAECIEWGRGKTVFNLDIKDVPLEMMAGFIASLDPVPDNIMYTVHNPGHVRRYLDRDPGAMFSCHCKTMEEFTAYSEAGMPWGQTMVYVGRTMDPAQRPLYDTLHKLGVMCMISVAPTHDRAEDDRTRIEGYLTEIAAAPDVIETDFPSLFTGLDLTKKPPKNQ